MYYYLLIALLIIVLIVTSFEVIKKSKVKTAQLVAVHSFKEQHQLTSRELKMFQDVLKETKEQIICAEEAMNHIADKNPQILSGVNASKEIFMHLMEFPKDLTSYGDFLYRDLPAFSSALNRYNTIQTSGVESEELSKLLKELELVILELSQSIIDDFELIAKSE